MTSSETADSGSEKPDAGNQVDVEAEAAELSSKEREHLSKRYPGTGGRIKASDRDRMVKAAREIHFPVALRGYDRAAVDRYVQQVNRLIAELEISSSPEAAVRHALEEVTEETRDLLQRAHQMADEITMRSRMQADERVQDAEREAQALREAVEREAQQLRETVRHEVQELRESTRQELAELREATSQEAEGVREAASREGQELRAGAQREADGVRGAARRDAEEMRLTARQQADETIEGAERRAHELAVSAETIWRERRRLIEDMRTAGQQLVALGEAEARRFTQPPVAPEEGGAAPQSG